jgi:hypothetical protein
MHHIKYNKKGRRKKYGSFKFYKNYAFLEMMVSKVLKEGRANASTFQQSPIILTAHYNKNLGSVQRKELPVGLR